MTLEEREEVEDRYRCESLEHQDGRAELANITCKLLWNKHFTNHTMLMNSTHRLRGLLEEHVRNIYELERAIPLIAYCMLVHPTTEASDIDLTNEQFEYAKYITYRNCVQLYTNTEG